MFSHLDVREKTAVVDAMEERLVKPGEAVIQQGEEGDYLYVVDKGTLSCFKSSAGQRGETFLTRYHPGDSFGELSLLHNVPRAATVRADGQAVLWGLDRETFKCIVKDAAAKKHQKYEEFLSRVKVLSSMEAGERQKLAEALHEEVFQPGEAIIREGEEGSTFYFLEEGEAEATKVLSEGHDPQHVMHYKAGDYFGERALIKNEPRAASVVAKTQCTVVTLDRHSFKRLLGPLEAILRRNMELYEQFQKNE